MAERPKSLMRSLGEFVGHIAKGIRSDPGPKRVVVNKTVEEHQEDSTVFRRTVIDEVEFRPPPADNEA